MHNNILKFLLASVFMLIFGCASNGRQSEAAAPKIDRISAEELARIVPKPVAKLSLDDLVRLTKEGNSPDQLIEKIKASDSMYDLTPSQSLALNRQGVDAKVLDYIHASHELAMSNNFADEILKREKEKRAELARLKNQLWQQRFYDPYCRFGYDGLTPYGYGAYGSHFGSGIGIGSGFGCW